MAKGPEIRPMTAEELAKVQESPYALATMANGAAEAHYLITDERLVPGMELIGQYMDPALVALEPAAIATKLRALLNGLPEYLAEMRRQAGADLAEAEQLQLEEMLQRLAPFLDLDPDTITGDPLLLVASIEVSLRALSAWLEAVVTRARETEQTQRTPSALKGPVVPKHLPQQTFQEMKMVDIALADGPLARRWTPVDGEVAFRHAVKDAPLQTRLEGVPLLGWLRRPSTIESLQEVVQQLGLPAMLLSQVLIGTALERQQVYVKISIDELISTIGWEPRSRSAREQMRATVWRWMLTFDAIKAVGQRRGTYRDPETKAVINTRITDALLRVMSTEEAEGQQASFDGTKPPLTVTYAVGPWIEQWKGNRVVLSYFGDLRRVAAIPSGKPSGAWAQSIGLALQQLWREQASTAEVNHVGEDNHITVRMKKPFTRRELLDLFPPSPTLDDVLSSPNPKRATEYWNQAIELLKEQKIVGSYQDMKTLPKQRKGWAEPWLRQPLDIRPTREGAKDIAAINMAAKAARKARAKHKEKRAALA